MPQDYASLILGLTEANIEECDSWGNKDFQHNPLFWSGQVLEPIINQWLAKEISRSRQKAPLPLWPQDKKFAVCLTHDVDIVSLNSLSARGRHLLNSLGALSGGELRLNSA